MSKCEWKRVSRRHGCPVCGKPDWCLTVGAPDAPDAVICARIESPKRCGDAGWLHRLRSDPFEPRRSRRVAVDCPPEPSVDFAALAAECEASLVPARRGRLAAELGVSVTSLDRLRVGWSAQHRAFTFRMSDAENRVRGIRLRSCDGYRWAVSGSRQGLFVPTGFCAIERLVICEGPTDTAALLSIGIEAVGRPSCSGGTALLIDLVLQHRPHEVGIIADRDMPGQRGARNLASRLVGYAPGGVRILTPPAKDAREWVRSGATRDDILEAIDAAPTMTLTYARRALG